MKPLTKALVAGAAAALMGSTALAQQIILVPEPGGQGAQAGTQAGAQQGAQEEQRFLLVPAPRFAPGSDAQARGADSSMAMELYRRGYQQGAADAERAGAARQAIDPAAIEQIGRELFERGYLLGMMQAQFRAQQQANQEQMAQQQAGQQQTGNQAGQQQAAQDQTGQQTDGQTAQAQTGRQGGQQAGQQGASEQATGQQESQLVTGQVGATPQTDMPEATIRAEDSQQHGQYLVDANGRAVYMFTADKQGQGDAEKAVSNCQADCAAAWPPVLSQSGSAQAMGAAKPDLVGTIQRQDGTSQVTYNGWPLYYYVEDQGQGEATGQDIHSFGGEWYLLKPEGEKVGEG